MQQKEKLSIPAGTSYSLEEGSPLVDGRHDDTMTINMGPQHPSTHGVLRLILTIDGETIVKAVPDIGFLHTGIEKTAESKSYHQALVLTDRMEYLSPLCNNLAYSLSVERLLGIEDQINEKIKHARVVLAELQRIASHLIWLGTSALDLGAQSMFLYCFREREVILDIFEMVSGVRMMTSYICPGGLQAELPPGFDQKVRDFLDYFPERLHEYHDLLSNNQLFLDRTKDVCKITREQAIAYGATGPVLRGSGVVWDIRKVFPYSGYEKFEFDIPVGSNGDVYDRYLVRMLEMEESMKIIRQALDGMPTGPYRVLDRKVAPPPKWQITGNMEALIHHFKLFTEGYRPPKGEAFVRTEAPKGELAIYMVSDGSPKPYRMHVRAPSFGNLQVLPVMIEGSLLSDVIAAIGSVDLMLGEVDR
ncbi:NADH-quinone oxidoreductase subunit D [Thermosporothrix hazakensis]|jgi:NADH-quinone oxidoreductase subunit D|uniref:NADH-quinone oxidoreductase subunit D n=2 Tax=Thermosporothrix TaxID=768650 RepID=A0A326U994_THEHA|nr:NADH dehydrogenase (quinone) subunit D [Thermosporothrix hazakensis]PZW23419.1 NADH-quinone oxidoreductase subunit D [Thermosporothrix hazakensis]BBH89765.1 NADH-quinone oxidoreductase subunit D 2 [Thermosporothrix sp. COM3]GCE47954.1 NADH-quinone oxidoreductase subunit D 2 [Thermosporothrix hazakensis]